jgi:hypothetical protein
VEHAGTRPQVAIVNPSMARRLFGGAAIGHTVRVAARGRYEESIDVRYTGRFGGREPVRNPGWTLSL